MAAAEGAAAARELAASALRLREWALRLFGFVRADPGPPPDVPAGAWELFLAGERCALPLQARLAAARRAPPAAADAPLRARATRELQHALSARAELTALARMLAAGGWEGVVLKGAVEATGGTPLDLADVDLLVRPEVAQPLAARLEEVGGHRALSTDAAAGDAHLAPRGVPFSLKVELHYRVAYLAPGEEWAGIRPFGLPGLWTLAPANHLWHVAAHSVHNHADRRGAVRDLLLARAAAERCGAGELQAVRRRARAARSAPLDALLAAVCPVGDPPAADAFRAVAALRYLMLARPPRLPLPRQTRTAMALAAYGLASGAAEYAALWGRAAYGSVFAWEEGAGSGLRTLPVVARPARALWRAAHLGAATVAALPMARAARRLAESTRA